MIKDPSGNWIFILSSGRKIYAVCHTIGIDEDLQIYSGHDGELDSIDRKGLSSKDLEEMTKEECDRYFKEMRLTKEEKLEIADYVIDLWQQFKAKVNAEVESDRS